MSDCRRADGYSSRRGFSPPWSRRCLPKSCPLSNAGLIAALAMVVLLVVSACTVLIT